MPGTGSLSAPITVDVVDTGTGTADSNDYLFFDRTLTFPAGSMSGAAVSADLYVTDDTLLEGDETIVLQLQNVVGQATLGAISTHTTTLRDNEVATADLSVTTHGDELGPVDLVFTVALDQTNNTGSPITFEFDDDFTGSALSGSDYVAIAANAQIGVSHGASMGTITVDVINDVLPEGTETIDVQISNPSFPAVTIATDTGTASIADEDTVVGPASEPDTPVLPEFLHVEPIVSFGEGDFALQEANRDDVETITWPVVDEKELHVIVSSAIDRFRIAGATTSQLHTLASVTVQWEHFRGAILGDALFSTIRIDTDGGGHGWFVDDTPYTDQEYVAGVARAGGPADGRVDLLTAVMHEMGHVLGFQHTEDPLDLMAPFLAPGVRRLPNLDPVATDHAVTSMQDDDVARQSRRPRVRSRYI